VWSTSQPLTVFTAVFCSLQLPAAACGWPRLAAAGRGYPRLPAATRGYLRLVRLPAATRGYPRLPAATRGYPRLAAASHSVCQLVLWYVCHMRVGHQGGDGSLPATIAPLQCWYAY
jgi:hypothetical protein